MIPLGASKTILPMWFYETDDVGLAAFLPAQTFLIQTLPKMMIFLVIISVVKKTSQSQ